MYSWLSCELSKRSMPSMITNSVEGALSKRSEKVDIALSHVSIVPSSSWNRALLRLGDSSSKASIWSVSWRMSEYSALIIGASFRLVDQPQKRCIRGKLRSDAALTTLAAIAEAADG